MTVLFMIFPVGVPAEDEARTGEVASLGITIQTQNAPQTEFYFRKSDAESLGCTIVCEGCVSCHRGLGRQPHAEVFRARSRDILKDEARVQNAEERKRTLRTIK